MPKNDKSADLRTDPAAHRKIALNIHFDTDIYNMLKYLSRVSSLSMGYLVRQACIETYQNLKGPDATKHLTPKDRSESKETDSE